MNKKLNKKELNSIFNEATKFHDIYKLMSDELYEGLILTHSLNKIKNVIEKHYTAKFFNEENYFLINYNFNNDLIIAEKELDKMLILMNNLGWFPSQIKINIGYKFSIDKFISLIKENIIDLIISFEAIYDNPVDIPDVMYHVTKLKYVDKILKRGLIPKRQEKLTAHPNRIYFTKTLDDALFFIDQLYMRTEEENEEALSILKIDTKDIKNQMRLFRDPNFKSGKNYIGFFTLNNIFKDYISLIDIIYP